MKNALIIALTDTTKAMNSTHANSAMMVASPVLKISAGTVSIPYFLQMESACQLVDLAPLLWLFTT